MCRALLAMLLVSGVLAGCATQRVQAPPMEAGHVSSDAAWQRLDADSDGALTLHEIEQQHMVALQEDLSAADANGDGGVSQAEFDAWWPSMTRAPTPSNLQGLNQSSAR